MTAAAPIAGGTALEHSLFAVPGLRCAGCIAKLERGLAPIPGIVEARVNFSSKLVAIDHLSDLRIPDLKAAIAGLGFEAEPIRAGEDADEGAETRALARATAVAGFAAMNIMLLSVSVWSGATGPTRDLFHLISGSCSSGR